MNAFAMKRGCCGAIGICVCIRKHNERRTSQKTQLVIEVVVEPSTIRPNHFLFSAITLRIRNKPLRTIKIPVNFAASSQAATQYLHHQKQNPFFLCYSTLVFYSALYRLHFVAVIFLRNDWNCIFCLNKSPKNTMCLTLMEKYDIPPASDSSQIFVLKLYSRLNTQSVLLSTS